MANFFKANKILTKLIVLFHGKINDDIKFDAESFVVQTSNGAEIVKEWIVKPDWMPQLIVLINPSQRIRFDAYLNNTQFYDGKFKIIHTNDKYPEYIFIQNSNPSELLMLLWNDIIINKYIHRIYLINKCTLDINFICYNKILNDKIIRIVANKKLTPILGKLIPTNIELHPSNYTHVLFAVKAYQRYYFGLYSKNIYPNELITNVKKSLSKEYNQSISRAYFKLKETFLRLKHYKINSKNILNYKLNDFKNSCLSISSYFNHLYSNKNNNIGLDIGSSPGGWTKFLIDIGFKLVISVDPGKLKLNKKDMTNVIHIQDKIENVIHSKISKHKYDIIVCDMNMECKEVIKIISQLIPFLRLNGYIIITLKLHDKMKNKRDYLINFCMNELRKQNINKFELIWLFANKGLERTLIGTKVKPTE